MIPVNCVMNLKHTTVKCAKIPSAHHNKVGCFENHQNYICLTKQMQPTTLLISDSIVVGLTQYQTIWKKYFKFPKPLIVAYLETRLNMFCGDLFISHLLNLLVFIVELII